MMNVEQIVGTGGVSGAVVVCCYFLYLLCRRKRSRCRSGTCSVDVADVQSRYSADCKEKEKDDVVKVEVPKESPETKEEDAP